FGAVFVLVHVFFFQAEDGIRDGHVTGVQTCALPIWFGIEESAKLFLVSLGVFFPIYVNTFHGIRSVDAGLIEMARSYGLSGWRRSEERRVGKEWKAGWGRYQ